MKVSLSSTRQNCCLIGYRSICDKDSFALSCLLIMSAFYFCCLCWCLSLCVGGMGEVDKADDQTVMDADDISLSFLI